MKNYIALVTIVILGLLLTARLWADNPGRGSELKIDNFNFTPQTLTVSTGTKVTWINRDDVPHTVTSIDNKFGSKVLDTDEQFSFTFTAAGTYKYYCKVHPHMTGTIVVR